MKTMYLIFAIVALCSATTKTRIWGRDVYLEDRSSEWVGPLWSAFGLSSDVSWVKMYLNSNNGAGPEAVDGDNDIKIERKHTNWVILDDAYDFYGWNESTKVVILIHGHASNSNAASIRALRNGFLAGEIPDLKIISVDYAGLSGSLVLSMFAHKGSPAQRQTDAILRINIPNIRRVIGAFCLKLKEYNVDLRNVQVLGDGIGLEVAAHAAKFVMQYGEGDLLGRLTGFNPLSTVQATAILEEHYIWDNKIVGIHGITDIFYSNKSKTDPGREEHVRILVNGGTVDGQPWLYAGRTGQVAAFCYAETIGNSNLRAFKIGGNDQPLLETGVAFGAAQQRPKQAVILYTKFGT